MSLTINQIMLLLDIYRGTKTQSEIGTYKEDLFVLEEQGLIRIDESINDWVTMVEGSYLIGTITMATTY